MPYKTKEEKKAANARWYLSHGAEYRRRNQTKLRRDRLAWYKRTNSQRRTYKRKWRISRHEQCIRWEREYRRKNIIRERARQRQWRRDHPNSNRSWALWKKYRITIKDYFRLFRKQGGRCAICRKRPNKHNRQRGLLEVDHNHKTGQVRSLLCFNCNIGIGNFKENIKWLRRTIKYLQKWERY